SVAEIRGGETGTGGEDSPRRCRSRRCFGGRFRVDARARNAGRPASRTEAAVRVAGRLSNRAEGIAEPFRRALGSRTGRSIRGRRWRSQELLREARRGQRPWRRPPRASRSSRLPRLKVEGERGEIESGELENPTRLLRRLHKLTLAVLHEADLRLRSFLIPILLRNLGHRLWFGCQIGHALYNRLVKGHERRGHELEARPARYRHSDARGRPRSDLRKHNRRHGTGVRAVD